MGVEHGVLMAIDNLKSTGDLRRWLHDSLREPGAVPSQISVLAARVYPTVNQSLATGAGEQIDYGAVAFDNAGMKSGNQLIAPTDGYYIVTATVQWAADVDGRRQVRVTKNGTNITYNDAPSVGATPQMRQNCATVEFFKAGDYTDAHGFHNAGNDLDLIAGYGNALTMARFS